jgi:hypothetical protein
LIAILALSAPAFVTPEKPVVEQRAKTMSASGLFLNNAVQSNLPRSVRPLGRLLRSLIPEAVI